MVGLANRCGGAGGAGGGGCLVGWRGSPRKKRSTYDQQESCRNKMECELDQVAAPGLRLLHTDVQILTVPPPLWPFQSTAPPGGPVGVGRGGLQQLVCCAAWLVRAKVRVPRSVGDGAAHVSSWTHALCSPGYVLRVTVAG